MQCNQLCYFNHIQHIIVLIGHESIDRACCYCVSMAHTILSAQLCLNWALVFIHTLIYWMFCFMRVWLCLVVNKQLKTDMLSMRFRHVRFNLRPFNNDEMFDFMSVYRFSTRNNYFGTSFEVAICLVIHYLKYSTIKHKLLCYLTGDDFNIALKISNKI